MLLVLQTYSNKIGSWLFLFIFCDPFSKRLILEKLLEFTKKIFCVSVLHWTRFFKVS